MELLRLGHVAQDRGPGLARAVRIREHSEGWAGGEVWVGRLGEPEEAVLEEGEEACWDGGVVFVARDGGVA